MHYHQRAGGVACTAARKQSGDSQQPTAPHPTPPLTEVAFPTALTAEDVDLAESKSNKKNAFVSGMNKAASV